MGTYNSAVITNGGQSMIAQAVAGASLEFTTIKTSNYAYPAGTNLATLTTINGIKQSKDITSATVYNSRVIKISAAVDNTSISTAYTINAIGIYAKVGSSAESLFAVVTASAADTMPAYSNKPYSYIYEINLTMQNAANMTVTVNAAGLVNVADLNAAKFEIQGEIADLKSAFDNITHVSEITYSDTFTAGKTLNSAGRIENNSSRIATLGFTHVNVGDKLHYSVTAGYRAYIAFYSSADETTLVSAKFWLIKTGTINVEGNYMRVAYASLNDATALTVADADKVEITYTYPLYDKLIKTDFVPVNIKNNLVSDGLECLPNAQVIQNGVADESNYGKDNVKYMLTLPEHNKLHVCFDYMYTKNVPYVVSGYMDIFQYSSVLFGSERHLGMGQFGILPRRIASVCGRGTSVSQIALSNDYMQRMGNPSFLVKYTGEYTSNTSVKITIGTGVLTITKDDVTIATINYTSADTIQSLIDKINDVDNITCDAIDTNGTCEDLLLISGHSIKLIPETIVSYGWDKTWHTFEALLDKTSMTYCMSFDGVTVSGEFSAPSNNSVVIGGDFNGSTLPLRLRNLEIDIDSFGDAEVINAPVSANATANTAQLISNRNPRLLIFEGHGIIVGSEAYAQSLTGEEAMLACSTDRLDALFTHAIANGYVPVKWQDVIAWKNGLRNLPKRCFAIMMDDYRIENYVDYDKRRPFVKHGVAAGLAMISDTHELTDTVTINGTTYTVKECLRMIELAGWYPCSHTRNHRRCADFTATQLIDEFKQDVISCDKHDMYSDVLVYPYGSTGYQTTSTMRIADFALGIDVDAGGTIYNCKGINSYKMFRSEIGTRVSFEKAIAPIV